MSSSKCNQISSIFQVANSEKQRPKYQILSSRLSAKIADYESATDKVKYLKEVALIAYGNGPGK